jgi:serine/threonine protein kinase
LAVLASDPDEVAGSKTFADPVFVRLAVRFQSEFDLCFVTQDEQLAMLLLASRSAGTGRKYLVAFIPMKGERLLPWQRKLHRRGQFPSGSADASRPQRRPTPAVRNDSARSTRNSPNPVGFRILTEITKTDSAPLLVSELPSDGSTVIGAKSGPIILVSKIAGGGEGTVYRTSSQGMVCKVYHPDCLTRSRQEKLRLMTSREIHIAGVCWPYESVSNLRDEFVGYMMPIATGKMLRTSVFAKVLLTKHFSHWTRIELTELAITMLKTIRELHYIGVLVGDVNPQNILVTDQHQIWIVDSDSFQVEGYPCTVGTETFTPPNRLGLAFHDFLRSHDDELFAVATLLFQTLFPGKAPYSAQGGGDVIENIRNMRFSYGKEADGRPPVGPWQFIWSHLNPRLKDDFTAVFARGERVGIDDFVRHLEISVKEMREGSRDTTIFPDRPWQREGQTTTVRCEGCTPDKAIHEVSVHLAERLKAEGKGFLCNSCVALRKITRIQNTREVDCTLKISPTCERRSQVSTSHLDALKRDGKSFWCRACTSAQREIWTAQRASGVSSQAWRGPSTPAGQIPKARRSGGGSPRPSSAPRSGSSPCFVATAVFQDPIATPVLQLRQFRDLELSRTVFGRALVRTYNVVGPWLARFVEVAPWSRPALRQILSRFAAYTARRTSTTTQEHDGDQYDE